MKRDMDLIRAILLAEEAEDDSNLKDYTPEQRVITSNC